MLLPALLSLALLAAPADEPLAGTVLLTETFDGPALPAAWTPTGGEWGVRDGRLHGVATHYLSRLTLPVPPLADVAFEVEAAFVSAKDPSRWLALSARQPAGQFSPFTLFTHRFDRRPGNGLEIGRGEGPAPTVQWNILAAAGTRLAPDPAESHRLRLELRGRTARGFIDGQWVIESERLPDAEPGVLSLVVSDATAWFDNLRVEALPPFTPEEEAARRDRQEGRGTPLIAAHRGNSRHAPENTLAAIREAFDAGADVVEVDVRRTRDGHLVLLHDDTFERTAGMPGRPEAMTLDEVRDLDAGRWKGAKYAGERVPTLLEALELAEGRGPLLLDLKVAGLGPGLAALLKPRGWEDRVLLGPWNAAEAAALRVELPHTPALCIGRAPRRLEPGWFAPYLAAGVRGFNAEHGSLTRDFVRAAAQRALAVYAWTVNDPAEMRRLAALGVTAILTDDPGLLRETLDAERAIRVP